MKKKKKKNAIKLNNKKPNQVDILTLFNKQVNTKTPIKKSN